MVPNGFPGGGHFQKALVGIPLIEPLGNAIRELCYPLRAAEGFILTTAAAFLISVKVAWPPVSTESSNSGNECNKTAMLEEVPHAAS